MCTMAALKATNSCRSLILLVQPPQHVLEPGNVLHSVLKSSTFVLAYTEYGYLSCVELLIACNNTLTWCIYISTTYEPIRALVPSSSRADLEISIPWLQSVRTGVVGLVFENVCVLAGQRAPNIRL